jgi:polysaccharide export outer membrane protein
MKWIVVFICLTGLGMAGCSSIPTAGPTTSQILDQAATNKQPNFDLVEVDQHVVAALLARQADSLQVRFQSYGRPQNARIGVGDSLAVSIWNAAGPEPLGSVQPGNTPADLPIDTSRVMQSFAIPEQVVAADGAISVPFAGRVRAAGRTPLQMQHDIEHLLADRAIEPQVIVTVSRNVSNTVTVAGDVTAGARVPLSVHGDRILDVIMAAGGGKAPIYETFVRLSRDNTTVTIPMDSLVSSPDENIYAWPGDMITLIHATPKYSVFGAAQDDRLFAFDADHIDLAQAIAKAGGLEDARADPAGVFLFRFEQPRMAAAIGGSAVTAAGNAGMPILYHLNLRRAEGYFLASRFQVQNGDIIYVASASLNDVQKFFTLIGTISGPVIGGVVVSKGSH